MPKIKQILNRIKQILNKIVSPWLSLPHDHKKRFIQSIALYILIVFLTVFWISINSEHTIKNLEKNLPQITVNLKNILDVDKKDNSPSTENFQNPKKPVFNYGNIAYEQKYISIIISGLGISKSLTDGLIEGKNAISKNFSLDFSPYTPNIEKLIKKANNAGYTTIISAPMESVGYPEDDPGEKALSSRFSDKKNKENIDWVLGRGTGAIAVMNFMGSRFLGDKTRLLPNLKIIKEAKSMFIENPTGLRSDAETLSHEIGLPYIKADLKIGNILDKKSIKKELEQLEAIANKRGYAIAIVEPYPFIFDILKTWSKNLLKRDIILTNVENLWNKRIKE